MRFPELAGYQYEDLLGEDPFGWTFVATHAGGKRRVIKVLKAQATRDRFIQPYFKAFGNGSTSGTRYLGRLRPPFLRLEGARERAMAGQFVETANDPAFAGAGRRDRARPGGPPRGSA